MSLTFKVQPQFLAPVYNPVVIVATSSNQTQLNYQLVSNIYCRGSLVTKMKTPVNPEGFMVVDIHKHLENRVSYDFNPGLTGFNIATQSFATYSVTFADEFRENWSFTDNSFSPIGATGYVGFVGASGGPKPNFTVGEDIFITQDEPYTNASYNGVHRILSITYSTGVWKIITDATFKLSTPAEGGHITYPNFRLTTITSTYSIPKKSTFNGVLSFLDFPSWDYEEWVGCCDAKFFTNVPKGGTYELDQTSIMFLNIYQGTSNAVGRLRVRTNLGTYSISNPHTDISTNEARRFLQVNASPFYFKEMSWIDDETDLIELWWENTSGVKQSSTYKFGVSKSCSKYEKKQLVFMDKMGSFIPFNFNLVSRQNKNINKTDYQQFYGSYAPASQNWTYNSWDRGRKSLDTVTTDIWTLNSDWVNGDTSDYLMELFESPEVYLVTLNPITEEEGATYTVQAINVTVQNIERKQIINDQIINYTLTFELSNKSSSQRG